MRTNQLSVSKVEVQGDHLAWHLGDTFIDFSTDTPQDQWVRIVEMLTEFHCLGDCGWVDGEVV